jgi:hypothetical protein
MANVNALKCDKDKGLQVSAIYPIGIAVGIK